MLHTKDFAFIHFQKTGGMSMTRYLINAVDDPVTVFLAEKGIASTRRMPISEDRAAKLTCLVGNRHDAPALAIQAMQKHDLVVPPWAFVMIRHPVDLMLSYYKHIRKPRVWKHRGMSQDKMSGHVRYAMEHPFDAFARKIRFYGKPDDQLVKFFKPSGFGRLDVVPLERISEFLDLRFGDQKNFAGVELEHHNKSDEPRKVSEIDPDTRAYIRSIYPQTEAIYEAAMTTTWDKA